MSSAIRQGTEQTNVIAQPLESPTFGDPATAVSRRKDVGALVVGGDHPGLGIARSLGRRGISVYILDDKYCISRFSRYATRVIKVDDLLDERKTVDAVL